jgi:hypothetical protein
MKADEIELDLYEMANLTSRNTGINNIIIWVGGNPERHAMRIKVSNIANKWSSSDSFTITLPYLDVVGKINKQLISSKKLSDIKSWIKLNIETLIEYEKGNIIGTSEFLEKLVKIQQGE